jgi:hypothetical protein
MVDVPSFVKSGRPPDAVVVADRLANPLPRNDLTEGAVRQLVELRRLSPDWIFSDDGTCESLFGPMVGGVATSMVLCLKRQCGCSLNMLQLHTTLLGI